MGKKETERELYNKYINKFQKFHNDFYSVLRKFLVNETFSKKISKQLKEEKKEQEKNKEELDERRMKYKVLLKTRIEDFCLNYISEFLSSYHSLKNEFGKFPSSKNKPNKKKIPEIPFRGLIFLHSREFGEGKNIAIPFGDFKRQSEAEVTNQVFNVRHEVNHILGETIWRFFKFGVSKKPCIYFKKSPVLENYGDSYYIDIGKIKFSEGFIRRLNSRSFPGNFSNKWPDELYEQLVKEKANKIIQGGLKKFKNFRRKESMFLIEGFRNDYNEADIRKLLANPIRQAVISDAENIFYIPDVHRSSVTGGLVCELALKTKDDSEISVVKLKNILNDLQWTFSNYVFAPISSCETEFGSGVGYRYLETFFTSKKALNKFKDSLTIKDKKRLDKDIYDSFVYFFESVSEKRGPCVRGFESISKKIFITICKLWDALKVYKLVGGREIGIADIKKLDANIEEFKNIRHYQPALELLWVALDFEGTLKNVPSYREHFIHSFHVFCLGVWILLLDKSPYLKYFPDKNKKKLLQEWFLAAMWHDVPYAIQKLAEISNIFIKKLVTHGYDDREKKKLLVPISPSWGHFLLVKDFYNILLSLEEFRKSFKKLITHSKNTPIMIETMLNNALETMLNKAEHGVLSGLIIYHQLCNITKGERIEEIRKKVNAVKSDSAKKKLYNDIHKKLCDSSDFCSNKLMPVIVAIILHHCYGWELGEDNIEKQKQIKKRLRGLEIDIKKMPLVYLLILCDNLAQAGREFYLKEEKSSPEKEIQFKNIQGNTKKISVILKYADFIDRMDDIKEKYFMPALDFLNCVSIGPEIKCFAREKNKTIRIEIINKSR